MIVKEKIISKRTSKTRKKYSLKDLVVKVPTKYKPKEEDWGRPAGKEVW